MDKPFEERYRSAQGLFAFLLLMLAIASAHEAGPAYLEIKETGPGQFTILWRTPVLAGMRLPIALRLPDDVKSTRQCHLPLYAFVVFVFVMGAVPADAHLNSTGMGPFYDGLMHFLMSPEDVVPVLGLALLAGLRGASYGRRALLVLPVAWLLGSLAGLSAMTAKPHPFIAAAWFLLLGGLLAADAKISLRMTTAFAALLGVYHGYLNGAGMGTFETAAVALLGFVFAIFVLIALAAAFVVRLRADGSRIAVRVAGSRIAASGLLMLGWAVRNREATLSPKFLPILRRSKFIATRIGSPHCPSAYAQDSIYRQPLQATCIYAILLK